MAEASAFDWRKSQYNHLFRMGCLNMMIGVTEEALADRAENYRKLALKDGFSKTKFIMWQVPPIRVEKLPRKNSPTFTWKCWNLWFWASLCGSLEFFAHFSFLKLHTIELLRKLGLNRDKFLLHRLPKFFRPLTGIPF